MMPSWSDALWTVLLRNAICDFGSNAEVLIFTHCTTVCCKFKAKTSFAVCCCSTKVRGANSSSECTYGAISWSAAWCDWRQQLCGSCTCAFTSQTTSLAKQVGQEKWDMTAQYYTKVPKQDCANLTMQSVAIRGKITRTIKQVQNSSDVTKTINGAAAAADSVTSYACNCCWSCSLTLLATDTLAYLLADNTLAYLLTTGNATFLQARLPDSHCNNLLRLLHTL